MIVIWIHLNFDEWTQEMSILIFTVNTTFKIATTLILETNIQYYGLGQQATDQVADLYNIAHCFLG